MSGKQEYNNKYVPPPNPNPSYQPRGYAHEYYNSGPSYQQGYQEPYYHPQQQPYYAPNNYYAQPQPQPIYVQQDRGFSGSRNGDCMNACLATMCVCLTLDFLFWI